MKSASIGAVCLMLLTGPLLAQQPGERVIVGSESAQLKQGDAVNGVVSKGDVLEVQRVHGNRLWVTYGIGEDVVKGWIHRNEVRSEMESEDAISEQLREQPTATAYEQRGRTRLGRGEFKLAVSDFDEVLRLDPTSAAAYYHRGLAHRALSNVDAAVADFTAAIERNSEDPNPYNQRGISYFDLGQYDRAIADYTDALRLAPTASVLYNNRGNAQYKKKLFDLAIVDYDRAIRHAPDDPVAYKNRGVARSDQGKVKEALRDFEKAFALDANDSRTLNSLAWFLATSEDETLRDATRAVKLAQRASVRTDWEDWQTIDTLAVATEAAGDLASAIQFQTMALDMSPKSGRDEMTVRLAEFRERLQPGSNVGPATAPSNDGRVERMTAETPPSPTGGNRGTLLIGEKTYALNHMIAYKAKSFPDEPDIATIVLATAEPLSEEDLQDLKESLAKDGTDRGFHVWSPQVKLTFNDAGEFVYFNGWADNTSLSSGSGVEARLRQTEQSARGSAVMPEAKRVFEASYRFDIAFDVVVRFSAGESADAATATVDAGEPDTPDRPMDEVDSPPPPEQRAFSSKAKDLPFPPDAREVEFDSSFEDVEYISASSLESLAKLFREQMPTRRWQEDTEEASFEDDEIELTFGHGEAEVVVNLSKNSDGTVDVELDCEELSWEGIDDPAGLLAAGVPQSRSYLFLQSDVPRPEEIFELEFEYEACEFKSTETPREAAAYYIAEMVKLSWQPTRSSPFVTDDLCRFEYQKGPISLDFSIFANSDPNGSRINIRYENESAEDTVPPLEAVVGPTRDAEPRAGDPPRTMTPQTPPVAPSASTGLASVTFGSDTYVLKHVAAHQHEDYGRETVLIEFADRPIPLQKLQEAVDSDDALSVHDLYGSASPVTFGIFINKDRMSVSLSVPSIGVGIGGHVPENPVREVKAEGGRVIGTVKTTQPKEVLSRNLQFEATINAAIVRPGKWPQTETIDLHRVTLTDEHGPLLPDNATNVEGSSNQYGPTVRATVPMTLPEAMAMYREELADAGWVEDEEARVVSIGDFSLVFRRADESLAVTLVRDDPQTRLRVTLRDEEKAKQDDILPDAGKARLILGNASADAVTVEMGEKSYSVKSGVGARDIKEAMRDAIEPGEYTVTIRIPGEDPQQETIEMKRGTSWGLVVLPTGGYTLKQLY